MTVEDTTSKQLAQQMGNSFEYPFTFTVLLSDPTEEDAKKAIKAKVKSAEGIITDLVYNSEGDDGYSVVLNDNRNGGVLTVNNKRTNNDYITIYREYEETQEADYQDFNAAPAETYEQNFDKLTMLSQQHQEQLDRCIKVEMMSDVSPEVLVEEVQRVWESIENIDIVSNDKVNIDNVAQNIEDINTCAENINAIADASNQAQNAALSAQIAQQSKNNAQIWAQGTDEEVQSLGGIHSSKGWAELATGGGADRDLSNLTSTGEEHFANPNLSNLTSIGEKHFLNKAQITNCILEAPNGVVEWSGVSPTGSLTNNQGVVSGFSESNYLTINKIPETVNSFEMEWCVTTGGTILSESQVITGQPAYKNFLCPQLGMDGYTGSTSGDGAGRFCVNCAISDSSWGDWLYSINQPLLNTTYWIKVLWDGTTIYFYLKTSKEADWELQDTLEQSYVEWSSFMAVGVDGASDASTGNKIWQGSIDLSQSYIKINGEIFWQGNDLGFNQFRVKEGLKTLIPNGRNENGTLRNIENNVLEDLIYTFEDNATGSYWAGVGETAVRLRKTSWEYKNDENYIKGTLENGNLGQKALVTMIGDMEVKNGNITSLAPYNPVALVSWDDESYKKSVYGYILPDYTAAIDMGLTASSPYTAPCDGWVIGSLGFSGSGNYYIKVNDVSVYQEPNDYVSVAMPVKAKDIVSSTSTPYNEEGNIKFYPCKGAYNV